MPRMGKKKVLLIGLESVINSARERKTKDLKNALETFDAYLDEVEKLKSTKLAKKTIGDPGLTLDKLEKIYKNKDFKEARRLAWELTEKWTIADFCAISQKALQRYRKKVR